MPEREGAAVVRTGDAGVWRRTAARHVTTATVPATGAHRRTMSAGARKRTADRHVAIATVQKEGARMDAMSAGV